MLVSIPVSNLIQGVSQQPPQMRLPSQLQEQVNGYPSLTDGLTKRPPTNHVAQLAANADTQFVHFINRDSVERYVVRMTSNTLKVFTLDGVEKNVYTDLTGTTAFTVPTYLNTPADIRAITVADFTFLVNRNTAVAMSTGSGTTSDAITQEALITVIQVGYQTDYTVTIKEGSDTFTYTHTSPASNANPNKLSTETVAADLVTKINVNTSTSPGHGVTATRYGSVIHLSQAVTNPASTFTVKVADSVGSSYIVCAKGKVSRLADLPKEAKHGFKIEIAADVEDPEAFGYFVKFTANDGVGGTGIWEETVGFSTKTTLDAEKMPYVLVRRSDTNFACYKPAWDQRTAGDATTAPEPSFVGRKIKDVFLFRNRLGFIADDKVILSEAGQYFNFFRTSTTMVLPSDPIDVSVGHSKAASLEAAIPWDERLILFSTLTQFSLGSGTGLALTPETVEVLPTTEYENASDLCRPEPSGRSMLFVQRRGSYSGIREYVRTSMDEKYEGIDITANVPAYLEGTPRQIAISTHDGTGFLRTSTGFYNYKWFVNGNEKIQSAWSKWDIGTGAVVQGMEWFDQTLYVVVTRASKTYLEKIDFSARFADAPLSWGVHLDRRLKVVATTTGAAAGTTKVPLTGKGIDYTGLSPQVLVVTQVTGGKWTVVPALVESTSATEIVITGSFDGKDVWVGVPYTMSFTFSRPYVRQGDVPVVDGRLQLTYGKVSYEETGHFTVGVTPKYRAAYSYPFNGGILGADLVQGTAFLATDTFRFPIHCRAEDASVSVSSSSFLPCRFQSAVMEGSFTPRNRQI
jgi:hypothetical protein